MMRLFVATFAALLLVGPVLGQEENDPDVKTIQDAYQTNIKSVLLSYLQKRTEKTVDEAVVKKLIDDINAKEESVRNQACQQLVQLGMTVVPALRKAANNVSSADATRRARKCLDAINGSNVTLSVIRLLAQHEPEGVVKGLLDFVPFAENDEVEKEVRITLEQIASRSNQADTALVEALKHESPIGRALAGEVLAAVGDRKALDAVLTLLKDPKPTVRFRAAMGLAQRFDPRGVPTLIELFDELPDHQQTQCHEYLTGLAGNWKLSVGEGTDPFSRELRQAVWMAWWKALGSEKLIAMIQSRTPTQKEREDILGLIKKLGTATPAELDKTAAQLVDYGLKAVPLLEKPSEDKSSVAGQRAARALEMITKNGYEDLPEAAVRVLGMQSSPKVTETLLAYLPYAGSEALKGTIREVLPAIAARNEKADPALLEAIQDPLQERRIAAVEALAAVPDQRDTARKLLKDKETLVQLAAAMALANAQDKEAIPVLIEMLSKAPLNDAWQVEEYLIRVAGDGRPSASLSASGENRKPVSDAWSKWWEANQGKVKLVRARGPQRLLGYTLVIEYYNNANNKGRVLELDRRGKVRWSIDNMQYPYDAEILGNNRVLIAEQNFNRVTERDFKGNILKTHSVNQPFITQRLRNGTIFIAGRYNLIELNPKGTKTYDRRVQDYMMAAARLKDGEFAYVTNSYFYKRLDRKGNVKKTFTLPNSPLGGSRYVEVLPNGNVLLTMYTERKVVEVDPNGKIIWEAKNINRPSVATRLSNGNTLVSCRNARQIVEVDRAGRQVKTYSGDYYPWKAYKR